MAAGTSRVERYLARLDELSGGVEPEFWPVESTSPGHHGVTAIGYRDLPELSICVQTDDPTWVLAIAHLAESLRHDCPFSYGNTINFGEPVAQGSDLDGFVVFAPLALDQSDARIEVGDDLPIHVVGMYPTYASERRFIAEHGVERFWQLDWDPYDLGRPPVT